MRGTKCKATHLILLFNNTLELLDLPRILIYQRVRQHTYEKRKVRDAAMEADHKTNQPLFRTINWQHLRRWFGDYPWNPSKPDAMPDEWAHTVSVYANVCMDVLGLNQLFCSTHITPLARKRGNGYLMSAKDVLKLEIVLDIKRSIPHKHVVYATGCDHIWLVWLCDHIDGSLQHTANIQTCWLTCTWCLIEAKGAFYHLWLSGHIQLQ